MESQPTKRNQQNAGARRSRLSPESTGGSESSKVKPDPEPPKEPDKSPQTGDKTAQIEQLMSQARHIRQQHETTSQQITEAKEVLSREELAHGQMYQQYLDLGRAIKAKDQQIREEKRRLQELKVQKDSAHQLMEGLIAQIGQLMKGKND